ncbi:MAG: restriction endonuclease, partial [Bacteroidia bacterium]|nr:restriction endonuclease [Bacteroidia bacterium]
MDLQQFDVVKSSGEIVRFSVDKLQHSLRRSGADEDTVQMITDSVSNELYPGISTKEIYNRAFSLLKKRKSVFASRYKLKKAIYELGPTGFPFERFVGAVLKYSGYETSIGITVKGKCVDHEVDVLAQKDGDHLMVECKFHGDHKNKCDVKIPLYIHSRY